MKVKYKFVYLCTYWNRLFVYYDCVPGLFVLSTHSLDTCKSTYACAWNLLTNTI